MFLTYCSNHKTFGTKKKRPIIKIVIEKGKQARGSRRHFVFYCLTLCLYPKFSLCLQIEFLIYKTFWLTSAFNLITTYKTEVDMKKVTFLLVLLIVLKSNCKSLGSSLIEMIILYLEAYIEV